MSACRFIRWFQEIGIGDVGLVGGKNASLGEMYRELTPKGIRIPNGFAVTAEGYRHFLKASGLEREDRHDPAGPGHARPREPCRARAQGARGDSRRLAAAGSASRRSSRPTASCARNMARKPTRPCAPARRPRICPTASFAGQQESFLNVRGERALLEACRQCIASLFTDRAISYRVDKGFDHSAVALSIGVQKMVRSDLGAAGVLFTLDTESGFPDVVLINSAYGLGESVVKGRVDPDEFLVFKPTLKQGHRAILKRNVGAKQEKLIYADARRPQHAHRSGAARRPPPPEPRPTTRC